MKKKYLEKSQITKEYLMSEIENGKWVKSCPETYFKSSFGYFIKIGNDIFKRNKKWFESSFQVIENLEKQWKSVQRKIIVE